jgi:hypothetical protein
MTDLYAANGRIREPVDWTFASPFRLPIAAIPLPANPGNSRWPTAFAAVCLTLQKAPANHAKRRAS